MSEASHVADRLVSAGMEPPERGAKEALFARAFGALNASRDALSWWVPGRVEFLGKHTDYAGGRSLLCAAERGFAVVATPRDDDRVIVTDACSGQRADAALRDSLAPAPRRWSNYVLTTCRRVARDFPNARRGVDIAFASDLPRSAGLSSSSALVVATFLAIAEANDLARCAPYTRAIRGADDLAEYLGAVENGGAFREFRGDHGVGTRGGSQDHTAILCSRAGALVQYAFLPVRREAEVRFPSGHVLVIAASGIAASKTGNALAQYNRAAGRAAAVVRAWNRARGDHASSVADVLSQGTMTEIEEAIRSAPDTDFSFDDLRDRVAQFRAEAEDIVPAATDALRHGDLARLGACVAASQSSVERLLGNQVPETIALAASARDLGAVAASAFGAGFGGSVYALVDAAQAADFQRRWREGYERTFPSAAAKATFFMTRAGPPAIRL